MKDNILSEKQQQAIIEAVSKLFLKEDEPIFIGGSELAKSLITTNLRTLQNEIIPLFNEASEQVETAIKYHLDFSFAKYKAQKEAYKTVIDLIDKHIQKVEKEV